jgi:murein DD-endopeptidase MepM/ murein hydrolase activator NlpD
VELVVLGKEKDMRRCGIGTWSLLTVLAATLCHASAPPAQAHSGERTEVLVFETIFEPQPKTSRRDLLTATFGNAEGILPPYYLQVGVLRGIPGPTSVELNGNTVLRHGELALGCLSHGLGRPRERRQAGWCVQKELDRLDAVNTLNVRLHGSPSGVLRLRVVGHLPVDRVLQQSSLEVGPEGAALAVAGAALELPADSVEAGTSVEFRVLQSATMDHLFRGAVTDVQLVGDQTFVISIFPSPTARIRLFLPTLDDQDAERPVFALILGGGGDVFNVPVQQDEAGRRSMILEPTFFSRISIRLTRVAPAAAPSPALWNVVPGAPSVSGTTIQVGADLTLFVPPELLLMPPAPLPAHHVTGHYFYSSGKYHGAVDLRATKGTPVRPVLGMQGSEIAHAGLAGNLGNRVTLVDRQTRIQSNYSHLDEIDARVFVYRSQGFDWPGDWPVGASGDSGLCGGAPCVEHLHFATWFNWGQLHQIDPEPLLTGNASGWLEPNPSNALPPHTPDQRASFDLRLKTTPMRTRNFPIPENTAFPYGFSGQIDASAVPPGTYALELWLNVPRLGRLERRVAEWQVTISCPTGEQWDPASQQCRRTQPDTGIVQGAVRRFAYYGLGDPRNGWIPVADTVIAFYGNSSGDCDGAEHETKTDASGVYSIELPVGDYCGVCGGFTVTPGALITCDSQQGD